MTSENEIQSDRQQLTTSERLNQFVDRVEANGIARLLAILAAIVGFVVVMLTAWQIGIDIGDRKDEREYRRLDRIEAARNRLLARAGGNTGKGEALTFLVSEGISIDGMDLSCRAVGDWNFEVGRCERQPIFTGIQIENNGKAAKIVKYSDINLSDTQIEGGRFHGIQLSDIDFTNAKISNTEFVNSYVYANFEGASLGNCHVRDTSLYSFAFGIEIMSDEEANISRTGNDSFPILVFCDVSGSVMDKDFLRVRRSFNVQAWADAPVFIGDPEPQGEFFGMKYEEVVAPLGEDDQDLVELCAPPVERGVVVPMSKRGRIPFGGCNPITYEKAKAQFPEQYKRTSIGQVVLRE